MYPFDSPSQLDKQNLIYIQANYNGQVMINWLSRDLQTKWDFFKFVFFVLLKYVSIFKRHAFQIKNYCWINIFFLFGMRKISKFTIYVFFFSLGVDRFTYYPVHTPPQSFDQE